MVMVLWLVRSDPPISAARCLVPLCEVPSLACDLVKFETLGCDAICTLFSDNSAIRIADALYLDAGCQSIHLRANISQDPGGLTKRFFALMFPNKLSLVDSYGPSWRASTYLLARLYHSCQ